MSTAPRVIVEHYAKEYVRGDIHTNNIEGFWSLLERGIGGVYHSVSEKYLLVTTKRCSIYLSL